MEFAYLFATLLGDEKDVASGRETVPHGPRSSEPKAHRPRALRNSVDMSRQRRDVEARHPKHQREVRLDEIVLSVVSSTNILYPRPIIDSDVERADDGQGLHPDRIGEAAKVR